MNTKELLQKSRSLFDSKQYLLAKEYAQAALEQDENCIEALFALAQCDETLGKTKAMASTLFKILSIETSNERALEKLRKAGYLGKANADNEVELVEKILDDGSVYLLPMREDKIEGFGAIVKPTMFYAGIFKDNIMHGRGILKGTNGSMYVGTVNEGMLEGEGTLISENYQVKTTFNGSEPDGKTPVEMKWKNGNKVVFRLANGKLEDINCWSDIKFFKADGTCYEIDIENGDSLDMTTGEAHIRKRYEKHNYKYDDNDQIQDPVRSVKPHTIFGNDYYVAEQQSGNNLYLRVDSQGCTIVSPTKDNKWAAYTKPTGQLVIPESFRICGKTFKTISIGKGAFSSIDSITDVVLPEGIQQIEESAFWGVKCTKIELPSTLKTIGDSAFYSSLIKHVVLPSALTAIGACCFCACHNLNKVVLNEGLVSIGMLAFGGSKITEVDVPSSVTSMYYDAFPEKTIIRFHGNPPIIECDFLMAEQEYIIYVKRSKETLFKRDEFWRTIKVNTF